MTTTADPARLYRDIVLDHSRNPRNCRAMAAPHRHAEGHNPLCGDCITLYLQIDGERIADVAFEASGCAISLASASMLTGIVRGRCIDEARAAIRDAEALFAGRRVGDLGDLTALAGVSAYPSRVRCALLPWRTLESALRDDGATTSTENGH